MIERVVVAVIWFFQVGILAFFLVMHFTNLLLILRAYFATRRYQDEMETDRFEGFFASAHSKPLSLICPAFNEEAGVVDSVNSLMGLHYPEFQVVVVNDGSVDGTLDKLIEAFHLRPSSRVVRQALPTKPIRGTYETPPCPGWWWWTRKTAARPTPSTAA